MKLFNFAAAVPWLTNNFLECKSWAGISLQKAINRDRRDQIKDNKASLIEFRNYLFSRQCALLFLLGKPSEVSRRAMEFLYNTVLEVIKLKVGNSKHFPFSVTELSQFSFPTCIQQETVERIAKQPSPTSKSNTLT